MEGNFFLLSQCNRKQRKFDQKRARFTKQIFYCFYITRRRTTTAGLVGLPDHFDGGVNGATDEGEVAEVAEGAGHSLFGFACKKTRYAI